MACRSGASSLSHRQGTDRSHDRRFPTELRLRKRREFVAVQSHGRKIQSRLFLIVTRQQVEGQRALGRLGITVSKRVGSAVTRNRIKRLVREFVRHNKSWLPEGHDVVVIAKRSAAAVRGLDEVARDLLGSRP